ncbi:MAG: hypothetical protein DCE90_06105 [Pseudanabaena sp.]|nr:MAG: hypothetical protein DCE90_06105 [Pseudanabaena sp.]
MNIIRNKKPSVIFLEVLLILIILLGILLRFTNLDKKVYWSDEVFTALRASGYSEVEAIQGIRSKPFVNSIDVQKYQYEGEQSSTAQVVIESLATEDPQHPPLYFLMSKVWMRWFGDTVTVRRSLSAVISLLAFPLAYWLCIELFNSSLVGLTMIALIAISPFHILYAQEARQYSLWIVTTLLSSATLLRALRKDSKYLWFAYAIATSLSLYTFLLSVLVAIAHGIYVLTTEGFRLSKNFVSYLVSTIVAFVSVIPWIWIVVNSIAQINRTTGGNKRLSGLGFYLTLVKEWIVNLNRIFIDLIFDSGASSNPLSPLTILLMITVLLSITVTVYSIYFVHKTTRKRIWLLIGSLIIINLTALILPDLILGDSRSMISRYFIPAYIGVQVAVAYAAAEIIRRFTTNSWKQRTKLYVMAIVFTLGVVSCLVNSQAQTSWIKGYGQLNHLVAQVVNQSERPLLISSSISSDILSLSYYLDPKVEIIARPVCLTCRTEFKLDIDTTFLQSIFEKYSDVFVINVKLPSEFDNKFKYKSVFLPNTRTGRSDGSSLWRLETNTN